MIPTAIYWLACAIGKCGPDDEPDEECISIAWEISRHLAASGYCVTKDQPA